MASKSDFRCSVELANPAAHAEIERRIELGMKTHTETITLPLEIMSSILVLATIANAELRGEDATQLKLTMAVSTSLSPDLVREINRHLTAVALAVSARRSELGACLCLSCIKKVVGPIPVDVIGIVF